MRGDDRADRYGGQPWLPAERNARISVSPRCQRDQEWGSLHSVDSAINPSVRAIQFSSNNARLGGQGSIDLAIVTIASATQIVVESDSRLAATCNNVYNYSSGLAAAAYAPYDGSLVINLLANGDQATGAIDTTD